MPKFYSLEQPSKEKKEELAKELHEYPELKPRLTFTFPLNKNRRNALEMIKSEKIDEEKVIKLLESDDFVEQRAGFYLLGQISNLSEEKSKKVLSILGRMSHDIDWDIREVVAQTLPNLGEKALPLLEKMSRDEALDVRKAVALVLGNLGEKALPIVEQMSQDENRSVRQAVLLALDNFGEEALPLLERMSRDKGYYGSMQRFIARTKVRIKLKTIIETNGEKALPLLKKMSRDKDWAVREDVVQALPNLDEKALPLLEKMNRDKEVCVREAVVLALGNLGEKALPILEKMSRDKEKHVRRAVAQTLSNLGEKALPLLEKMRRDKGVHVREAVVLTLGNLGEKALPILEKMDQNGHEVWVVEEAFSVALMRIKHKYDWLLATQKPLFTTPYTKKLAEKILKLEEITKELKNKFKDKFIGLTIFGSLAKGYLYGKSDIDCAVVAKDRRVSKYFEKLAEPLNLCFERYVGVDKKDRVENPKSLFYGLFFGDRPKLIELQKKVLKNMNKEQWNNVRKEILKNETDLEKATERYGIEKEETEKIKQFIALLRVPPSYEETLKIVQERIK